MKIDAIDILISTPFSPAGIAYYRLPNEVMEFFKLCQTKHMIAGFTWDSDEPRNFGVILKHERDDHEKRN